LLDGGGGESKRIRLGFGMDGIDGMDKMDTEPTFVKGWAHLGRYAYEIY